MGLSGGEPYVLDMDFALIVASLVSFFGLILGWVVLPHSAERGAVASTEVAPQPASTAA
jgi:hypothetical protein